MYAWILEKQHTVFVTRPFRYFTFARWCLLCLWYSPKNRWEFPPVSPLFFRCPPQKIDFLFRTKQKWIRIVFFHVVPLIVLLSSSATRKENNKSVLKRKVGSFPRYVCRPTTRRPFFSFVDAVVASLREMYMRKWLVYGLKKPKNLFVLPLLPLG